MTRKVVKKLLPIMQAFADGKQIQYRILPRIQMPYKPFGLPVIPDTKWYDFGSEKFDSFYIDGSIEYRIKPDVKYRPFTSKEECCKEMMKHNEFGWVKSRTRDANKHISNIEKDIDGNVWFVTMGFSGVERYSSKQMFDYFEFMDGVPFGIKED